MKSTILIILSLYLYADAYEYKQLKRMNKYGTNPGDTVVMYYNVNTGDKSSSFPVYWLSMIINGKLKTLVGDLDCPNSKSWLKIGMIFNEAKLEKMDDVSGANKFEKFSSTTVFGKMCSDLEAKENSKSEGK